MNRVRKSKVEKQTLYEIYRSCRLCGAETGYKMPIIQNVVDLDCDGVELRHKIRECLQIEVTDIDRMPPLICELCVDKVNGYYEFFIMCKQTNKRTRHMLGLPLQTLTTQDSQVNEKCNLGVTVPVYVEDSDVEKLISSKPKKQKLKVPPELSVKTEEPTTSKSKRNKEPPAEPPPPTKRLKMADTPKPAKPGPKSSKSKLPSAECPKTTDKDITPPTPKPAAPKTTLKVTAKPATPKPAPPKPATPKPATPKSATLKPATSKSAKPKPAPKKIEKPREPVKTLSCCVCNQHFKNSSGLAAHNILKHLPTFTSPQLACNACELWFPRKEEAAAHHRDHLTEDNPYKCTRCYGYFEAEEAYNEHFGLGKCLTVFEVPDLKCWECWRTFPTSTLMEGHKCPGEDGRQGGKCNKCGRNYALLKNLIKHEATCNYRKKGEAIVEPSVQASLLPMQVRVARCDPLLVAPTVDVSKVPHRYGLDCKRTYPYLSTIKKIPSRSLNQMVTITDDVKVEFADDWASDNENDTTNKNESSLISEVKSEANDISKAIDSIIDNLDEDTKASSWDSDSILDKGVENAGNRNGDEEMEKEDKVDKMDQDNESTSEQVESTGNNESFVDDASTVKDYKSVYKDASMTNCDKTGASGTSVEGKSEKDNGINGSLVSINDDSQTSCSDTDSVIDKNKIDETENTTTDVNMTENSESVRQNIKESKENGEINDDGIEQVSDKISTLADNQEQKVVDREPLKTVEPGKCEQKDAENHDRDSTKVTEKKPDYSFNLEFQRSPTNEDFSKIDEITNKILQDTASVNDENDHEINNSNIHKSNEHMATITSNNEDKNGRNNLKDTNGENKILDDKQADDSDDKKYKSHLIDDLLKKNDDLKSLDLDNISDDEFNFDV